MKIKNKLISFKNIFENTKTAIILISIISITFLSLRILLVNSYAPDLVVGEDNNVWNIQKMLNGDKLYTNPEQTPYEIFQYSPISQYPVYWISKLMNIQPGNDVHLIFQIGRLVSLIFNILSGFVIFKILRSIFQVNYLLTISISLISFIDLPINDYTLRTDALFNLFSLLSIYYLLKFILTNKIKYLTICTFYITLSLFTKQTGIQFYIFLPLYFLIFKQFKNFIITSCLLCIFLVLMFLFFYSIYGEVFTYSLTKGIANRIDIIAAYHIWYGFYFHHFPLVFICFFTSYFWFFSKKNQDSKVLISFLSLFILIFSVLTSLKVGSSTNYYTIFNYLSFVIFGVFLNEILTKETYNKLIIIINIILILIPINIIADRVINKHTLHLNTINKKVFFEDLSFSKKCDKLIKNNELVFTPNKNIKNFLPKHTIFPNTEYYGESFFNYDHFKKNKKILKYIILNELDNYNIRTRTLEQFKIDITKYDTLFYNNGRIILKLQ